MKIYSKFKVSKQASIRERVILYLSHNDFHQMVDPEGKIGYRFFIKTHLPVMED